LRAADYSLDYESAGYGDRCEFWIAQSEPKISRRLREREATPLILTGHGLSLRVDRGCLLVRDGNTHYPGRERQWRFFNGSPDIPPAFVVIDGSGEFTVDAIDWLATQGVSLIRLRWDGQFSSLVTAGGQAASPNKVRWQQGTRDNPTARLQFGITLIREKARSTMLTMEQYLPRSAVWDRAYNSIANRVRWLDHRPPRLFGNLLGMEAAIAGDYFRVWPEIPLKWKALKRHPIPNDWTGFVSRGSHDQASRNRNATHPVNAMLNYAYGVLIAQTQVRLISEGYDPSIGIMHDRKADRGSYPAFALDQMEPMRPVVDRAVLHLINAVTFTGADFSIQHDGVCRLNPELARRVAQLAMGRCVDGCKHHAAFNDRNARE